MLHPGSCLADTVASELEKRILDGSLKQGDLLPCERDLALELGVARPSFLRPSEIIKWSSTGTKFRSVGRMNAELLSFVFEKYRQKYRHF